MSVLPSWAVRLAGVAVVVGVTVWGPAVAGAAPDQGAGSGSSTTADGMSGDPAAAAPYWQQQSLADNCGAMSVADVVGEITGDAPTEAQILAVAEQTDSEINPWTKIYVPDTGGISVGDLPVLLKHYGIAAETADGGPGGLAGLEQNLGSGRKVIAYVNSALLWNTADQRTDADHFVVVTGVDANQNVVHLNDPGADNADEQIAAPIFMQAWHTGEYDSVVTAA
ncbi:C39 family peptidase [soil metagenome]